MAKVIGPLHSTEARGRIDDLVYGTWHGIRFVRKFTPPVFGSPDPREAQKALVAAANSAWKLLTNEQRSGWHAYAQAHPRIDWTGVPVRISGYNSFVSCHVTCSRAGGTPLLDAPSTPFPFPLNSVSSVQSDNFILISWTYPTQPTTHTYKVQIWRSGPWSLGRVPDFHRASIILIDGIATSPYDDTVPSDGRYGYWLRVVDVTTGELSPFLRTQTDFVYSEPIPPTGSIAGTITIKAGSPPHPQFFLITADGYNTNNDPVGYYILEDLPAATYTVTPSKANWTLSPVSRQVVLAEGQHVVGQNFEATYSPE